MMLERVWRLSWRNAARIFSAGNRPLLRFLIVLEF
jgi:hypothetical protein